MYFITHLLSINLTLNCFFSSAPKLYTAQPVKSDAKTVETHVVGVGTGMNAGAGAGIGVDNPGLTPDTTPEPKKKKLKTDTPSSVSQAVNMMTHAQEMAEKVYTVYAGFSHIFL